MLVLLLSGDHDSEPAGYQHLYLHVHALKLVCLLKVAGVLYACMCKVAVSMYVQSLHRPSTTSHHC